MEKRERNIFISSNLWFKNYILNTHYGAISNKYASNMQTLFQYAIFILLLPFMAIVFYSFYPNSNKLQTTKNMLKRLILPFLLLLPALYVDAQEKPDSVYEFRFVPQKDMFFIPYQDNRTELERLSAIIIKYKALPEDRHILVNGYCNSVSSETENKRIARIRSNRVKSELIKLLGLTEASFITCNHATTGDVVLVKVPISALLEVEVETVASEETKQPAITEASSVIATENKTESDKHEPVTEIPDLKERKQVGSSFALRANLLRWATLTPDLGIEWRINRQWAVLVNGSWTSWSWDHENRRYALWKVSPEVRYYIGKEKRGFFGAMYHVGDFNYKLGTTGKQGDYQGGGITGGYVLPLNRSLCLDFHAAAGYTCADYDTYRVTDGVRVWQADEKKNYWGINQLGVTLVWKLF